MTESTERRAGPYAVIETAYGQIYDPVIQRATWEEARHFAAQRIIEEGYGDDGNGPEDWYDELDREGRYAGTGWEIHVVRLSPEPAKLTQTDWTEIYYAVESKMWAIRNGHYDPEDEPGQHKRWLDDLEEIQRKLGPDGTNMHPEEER